MKKFIKIILFLIGLIIIIFGGLILIDQQSSIEDQGEKENSQLGEEYPNNVLQGVVKAVDIENKNLTLVAKTGLIKTSQKEISEKVIRIVESTICEIYHIDTKETDSCEFSEIVAKDNIIVVTFESTYDEINNLEEFTASKISKIVD